MKFSRCQNNLFPIFMNPNVDTTFLRLLNLFRFVFSVDWVAYSVRCRVVGNQFSVFSLLQVETGHEGRASDSLLE